MIPSPVHGYSGLLVAFGLARILALCLAVLPAAAKAGCQRPLEAPASPSGRNVMVHGAQVSGALFEFLQAVGVRAGCEFRFPILPRARVDRQFMAGEVDVLFPASRTTELDRSAVFVPWYQLQAHLVTVRWNTDTFADLRELLARTDWNGVMVRGYSWGDDYDAFVNQLERQGRVALVADLGSVHAMLRAGHARFTLLPPSLLYTVVSASRGPPDKPAGLPADFVYQRLPDLPATQVGMYLNPRRVSAADVERLTTASALARTAGQLKASLERHYPAAQLLIDVKIQP